MMIELPVVAKLDRGAGDTALLVGVDALVHRERPSGNAADFGRMQRLGAAAHAAQPAGDIQGTNVATDRCFRSAGEFDQTGHGDDRPLGHFGQYDAVALNLVHSSSRADLTKESRRCQSKTVKSDSIAPHGGGFCTAVCLVVSSFD